MADSRSHSSVSTNKERSCALAEAVAAPNFDAKLFLADHLKGCSGDFAKNLRIIRANAQALSDSYTDLVKKNVFCNYNQFVQTAKTLLELENEITSFGNLLSDQKAVIDAAMNMPFCQSIGELRGFGKRVPERRNLVQQLLDTVENCQLKDGANMELLFESDLTQLNADNMAAAQIVHAFLFTDGLMLTTFVSKRLSSVRYRFSAFYELENVAFINVKNSEAWQNVFKVLIFPEQIYFSCESSLIKKQWFDSVERAKKLMLRQGSLLRQATIRVKAGRQSNRCLNAASGQPNSELPGKCETLVDVEWLKELPDELDVCIAQRDFNSALELLTEGRDCLSECGDQMLADELRKKFDQRQHQLTEKLIQELKPASDKYLQGGPRATRKAITLLIKLGKIAEACDLYLKNRSVNIKFSIRELKVIDSAVQYVEQLNRAICSVIIETVKEFGKLFVGFDLCFSVLVVWASSELKNYANLFVIHVFDSGCCLSVASSCLALAFGCLQSLTELNLDLSFQLELLLHPHIKKLIHDAERLLTDATSLRIAEDRWRPFNLQSEANLLKFIQDCRQLGLDVADMKFDDCRLWLTGQVCNYARAVVPFCRHLGSLCASAPFALTDCQTALANGWSVQLNYVGRTPSVDVDQAVYNRNVQFVIGYLMPLCEENFRLAAGLDVCGVLKELLQSSAAHLLPFYRPLAAGMTDIFETIGDV